MQTIIITTTDTLWQEAQKRGVYTRSTIDSSLEDVGFIHATTPDQVIPMLNRHFTNRDDILLLLVNLSKIISPVKFEAPLSGRAGRFPHIYGTLNTDAVYRTVKPEKDDAGDFILSDELAKVKATGI